MVAGKGDFVKYLRNNAVNAYGYDPYIKFNGDGLLITLHIKKIGKSRSMI